MTKLKLNLPPPDGTYSFLESDGALIQGTSWVSVMGLVAGYRKRNGLPEGNPVAEVIEQVKRRYPDLVYEEPEAPVPPGGY